jgi:AraC-like DNA-binding protein
MPPVEESTISTWILALVRALDAAGLDGAGMARAAGVDPAVLEDPERRSPIAVNTRLWRLAVEATGDPCFGLRVARYVTQTTFHGLGLAAFASPTLREAFERIARWQRLVSDAIAVAVEPEGDRWVVRRRPPARTPPLAPEAIDAFVAIGVTLPRALHADPSLRPLVVRLERPEPPSAAPFHALVRAPIEFGAPEIAIEFSRELMDRPVLAANLELARAGDAVARRYVERLEGGEVTRRVRARIAERLADGRPTQDDVARRLGMSTRSLARRLDEEGTSFSEILRDALATLARDYLRERRLSVSEVAFLLGFSGVAPFSRAFKQWTGRSPSEFQA